jgi:hypothetical protein
LKLNDMRIGLRLGGGFGVILALLVVIVAIGTWRMESVASETRRMMAAPLTKERLTEEWFRSVAVGVVRGRAIAKSADPSLEALFADEVKASTARGNEINKALGALPMNADEQKLLDEIANKRKTYIPAAGRQLDGAAHRHRAPERRSPPRPTSSRRRRPRWPRAAARRLAGRRHDGRDQRVVQEDRRHHRRDRRHRVPDQHPGAERRGGSGARRRTGPRLRGRGRRSAQPGAAQRRSGQGDQGADRRLGRQGRVRLQAGADAGSHDDRDRRARCKRVTDIIGEITAAAANRATASARSTARSPSSTR